MVKATTAAIVGVIVFLCNGMNNSDVVESVSAETSKETVQVIVEDGFAVVVEDAKLFVFDAAGNKIEQ